MASTGSKRPQDRLKLTIRLLPPGLTEVEFKAAMGSEWLVGGGKVDWMEFANGKIAKNPSKHSKPATVWLHLIDSSSVVLLEEKLHSTSFVDAKNTSNDPILPGLPVLEYALSQKIPSARKRIDSRMGTIDQDPDFKRFLESLTNPIQKPAVDLEASLHKEDMKVTTTPLIEHLREKKAAKEAKPSSKSGKEGRESGKNKRKGKDVSSLSSSSEKSKKSTKAERAAKQGVKVLTRQASTTSVASSGSQTSEKASTTTTSSAPAQSERRRDRGGPFNIAAKIQRDLGLGPASPRRGMKGKASANDPSSNTGTGNSTVKESSSSDSKSTSSSKIPEGLRKTHRGGRGNKQSLSEGSKEADHSSKSSTQPTILKKPNTAASAAPPLSTSTSRSTPSAPSSSTNTTSANNPAASTSSASPKLRAFLKHANPSQGITEPLLQTALSTFGPVLNVEIDKRKGIAHADFGDAAGLAAAIKAGKVDVANGAVQILPFRERPSPKAQGGGGGGGSTAGGGAGSRGGGGGSGGGAGRGAGRSLRGRGGGGGGTGAQIPAQTKGLGVSDS